MRWSFLSILASQVMAEPHPVPEIKSPLRAPLGGLPAGCVKSYNGPSFKLAALALDQQGGARLVAGGVILPVASAGVQSIKEPSKTVPHLGYGQTEEEHPRQQQHLERRTTKVAKLKRRQAPSPSSEVVVSSRTTTTSTATITVSPGPAQPTQGSWTKTVYGATVNQAPNGQVQIVQTPVPIILQSKGPAQPTPLAPLPASIPRVTQAANGQVQAGREPKAAQAKIGTRAIGGDQGVILELSLANGMLKDKQGKTGYISAARQFQFDNPAQFGAAVTTGFSVCDDGLLALGSSKIFYQCRTGSIYNVYDQKIAGQCSQINLLFFEEYKS